MSCIRVLQGGRDKKIWILRHESLTELDRKDYYLLFPTLWKCTFQLNLSVYHEPKFIHSECLIFPYIHGLMLFTSKIMAV